MHYLKKLLDSLSQNKKQIEEISEYVLYKNINIGERERGSSSSFYGTNRNRNFDVVIKIENKKKSLLCES